MPEPSTSHIGQGVALGVPTAAFVYIYARIPQIAEMILKLPCNKSAVRRALAAIDDREQLTACNQITKAIIMDSTG